MQSQLAQLHEKHGQEALRAEQLETLNNDSKINLEHLISGNAALSETIERLEYENKRLSENFNLEKNDLKDKSSQMQISPNEKQNIKLGSLPAKNHTIISVNTNLILTLLIITTRT